ncbi:unnamed protein product [Pelagomonas calceolata]|uniref:C-type lectin domain-containing protein n=3 Tax=Pelagomonas calceolata TaxID=35677 RepID=A0A8J2SFY1_9STRA|nr:unnamed protein product [Pelagomonas calceolata]
MKSSCATKGKRLCTYGELCPNGGPHQAPYGGQQASTDMWAPITPDAGEGGSTNQDWVQIGTRDGGMCNKHSSFYGGVHADECCCGDWCNTNVQQEWKRIYACCDGEGGSSTTTTGTNCRSDICTDIANDCCAPGGEARGCSITGYEVQPDPTGTSGYGPCVSTYGQESVYQCCATSSTSAGSGSFVYVDQAKSFDDARAYCRANYHDLASIHSSSENAAVAALCPGESCWIGGSDAAQEGTWTWSDGTAWDYDNWESGEPNNWGGDEPYTVIYDSGRWNDESRYGTYPFVCATTFTITSSNVHWDECPGECAAIGGTFACIDDESQNGQALAAFGGSCPDGADDCGAWIAVNDKASEGNWICTADGSTQTYQPWSAIGSEPNGGSGENCANMWGPNSGRNDGAWNDYGCTGARMPCICRGGGGGSSEDLFVAGPSGGNYYDATAYCSSIGASIATIYSATENELARQACGGSSCWIGLEEVGGSASTPKASQTWRWMDGSTASYTNWDDWEPNNHDGNDERNAMMNCCGTDGVDASGMWHDAPYNYDEPRPLCRTDDCGPSSGGCDPIYNFAGATRTCTSSNYPENCIVVVENSQHADCNAWCAAAGSWCINGWDSHGGSCDNIDQTDDTWPQGCGGDNLFHDGICMCAPVGGTSSQTDGGPCTPQRADNLDDDGPDAASAATIIACVAAAMCAVLIGVVGFLYWKMQQVQGRPVRPVGQAIAVEMATYGQTMAAPSYVLKAASAPPGRSFCVDCGAAIQGRFCGACGRNQPAGAQPAAEPPFVAPTPNLFRRQPMDNNQGAPQSLPVEIISAAGQGPPAGARPVPQGSVIQGSVIQGSVVPGSVVQGSAVQESAEQGYI